MVLCLLQNQPAKRGIQQKGVVGAGTKWLIIKRSRINLC